MEVYFVDFGNTDKVDATDVLALPAEFGGMETQVKPRIHARINVDACSVLILWAKVNDDKCYCFSPRNYST